MPNDGDAGTRVQIELAAQAYSVHIGPGLLQNLGPRVRSVAPNRRAVVIADENVSENHAATAVESLESCGYRILLHVVAEGESSKNLDTVRQLYDHLLAARIERRSPVISVAGGVIGDTVGFAAATFLRGVPLVLCPTTLLAMVDASVGGKVGVNLPQGKNLVGAFYQPTLVVADINTLFTLTQRDLRCGLAECVKHGMVRDPGLFDWLECHLESVLARDSQTLTELVHRNVQIKGDVVMADERESSVRMVLNFGHTFAHAIEATQNYGRDHHGEAVSLGMIAATHLAIATKQCSALVLERLRTLLLRIGLPIEATTLAPTSRLLEVMRRDKKVADERIRLVLPHGVGHVVITEAPDSAIAAAWEALRRKG